MKGMKRYTTGSMKSGNNKRPVARRRSFWKTQAGAPTYEIADMSAAMIEMPAAHHGTLRPARKKSSSDFCFLALLDPMYITAARYDSRIANSTAC